MSSSPQALLHDAGGSEGGGGLGDGGGVGVGGCEGGSGRFGGDEGGSEGDGEGGGGDGGGAFATQQPAQLQPMLSDTASQLWCRQFEQVEPRHGASHGERAATQTW